MPSNITPGMVHDALETWYGEPDEWSHKQYVAMEAVLAKVSAALSAQPVVDCHGRQTNDVERQKWQAVAVKTLEWEDEAEEFSDGNARVSHTGSCIFGQWYMIYREDGEYYVSCNYRHVDGVFKTIDAAKAAAQADYSARILSALTTPPAPASSEPVDAQRPEVDGGDFANWKTSDFIAECRAQSLEQLDPDFSRFMAELANRLAAPHAPTGDGWRPIETAPKDEMVLVVDVNWPPALQRDQKPPIKVGYLDGSMLTWKIFGASWRPTHWQPLPAAPTPEGGR